MQVFIHTQDGIKYLQSKTFQATECCCYLHSGVYYIECYWFEAEMEMSLCNQMQYNQRQ